MSGWTARDILSVGSITHGRSRRWTSGSAVTRDAGSISGASVGRMVSPGIGTKISPTTYDMLIKPDTQG